jgi:glutamine synthetase type III
MNKTLEEVRDYLFKQMDKNKELQKEVDELRDRLRYAVDELREKRLEKELGEARKKVYERPLWLWAALRDKENELDEMEGMWVVEKGKRKKLENELKELKKGMSNEQ